MPDLSALENSGHSDFVGREPGWIVKSGIGLLLLIFSLFLGLTWVIKYPDTIDSRIRVAAKTPPVDLVAKASGKIDRVFITDGVSVVKGSNLLLIESDLNFETLEQLENKFESWDFKPENMIEIGHYLSTQINTNQLGSLQESFNQLLAALENYRIHLDSVKLDTYKSQTENKLKHYSALSRDLKEKLANRKEKLVFEKKVLEKNQKLFNKGATSESVYFKLKSQYLDLEVEIIDINNQKNIYELEITKLSQELDNMRISIMENRAQLMNKIHQHKMALLNDINDWKKKYLIRSPIDGKVSFSQRLSQFQHINNNETVISVYANINIQVGQMVVKHTRSGKIMPGQDVFINLDSLPANEYGHLKGKVKSKASVPTKDGLLVNIELANPVITDFGYDLPQSAELYGTARIVTKERRLLSRFFDQILAIMEV